MDNLSAVLSFGGIGSGIRFWDDLVVGINGNFHCFFAVGFIELYRYYSEFENQRNENDQNAVDDLGVFYNSSIRCTFLPRSSFSCSIDDNGSWIWNKLLLV